MPAEDLPRTRRSPRRTFGSSYLLLREKRDTNRPRTGIPAILDPEFHAIPGHFRARVSTGRCIARFLGNQGGILAPFYPLTDINLWRNAVRIDHPNAGMNARVFFKKARIRHPTQDRHDPTVRERGKGDHRSVLENRARRKLCLPFFRVLPDRSAGMQDRSRFFVHPECIFFRRKTAFFPRESTG
jgi:hypothetical protein